MKRSTLMTSIGFGLLLPLTIGTSMGRNQTASEIEDIETTNGGTVRTAVALSQLNRIVLPFEQPEVRTLNPATTELQGRILYLAPVDTAPIHLLIGDTKDENHSLTLSLTPKEIPPREIQLLMSENETSPEVEDSPHSETSPMPTGAEQTTRTILRTLALGSTPEGYRLRSPKGGEAIHCHQRNVLVTTRKVLDSSTHQVWIGLATNKGKEPMEIEESQCAEDRQIEAVATYPQGTLSPGKSIEIYVVFDKGTGLSSREFTRSAPAL